jgi:hypothetical protein
MDVVRSAIFPAALMLMAVAALAQTFEPAQCSSDRVCAAVPLDDGSTASINASVKAAPACSVSLDGGSYTGTCTYSSPYGSVQFSNGYSYYQDIAGSVCSPSRCASWSGTFEFKQTRTVSGRLAGRVQNFWWLTGGSFQ